MLRNVLASVLALYSVSSVFAEEAQRAFPGAEGFGAYSRGGRGGEVYCVTTLDDYHPGAVARGPVT